MFFGPRALLKHEYERLFTSAFSNPELTRAIVELLSAKSSGFSRAEISEKTGISKGGTFSDALNALEASGFVMKYTPFRMKKNDNRYKLMDPFCILYLKFVKNKDALTDSFWRQNINSQEVVSWRGFAFENVCLNHIMQIKEALGISGVSTRQSVWIKRPEDEKEGTQVDLIIDRNDGIVNMCEIKYYSSLFSVDKRYHEVLMKREGLVEESVKKGRAVHSTLITTYGLKYNEYSGDFDNVITMDDLFGK